MLGVSLDWGKTTTYCRVAMLAEIIWGWLCNDITKTEKDFVDYGWLGRARADLSPQGSFSPKRGG